jgi:hypothetical protein
MAKNIKNYKKQRVKVVLNNRKITITPFLAKILDRLSTSDDTNPETASKKPKD